MFGILDRLYVRGKKGVTHEEVNWNPEVTVYDDSNISWYCFVPKVVMRDGGVKRGILPQTGKVTSYTTSYVNLLAFDAIQTRDNLRQIYFDAMTKINEDLDSGRDISVIGVSIGNVLSLRCAGEVPEGKINTLVSIAGGSNLGLSAWDSIATKDIAQNSGCATVDEYESILSEFAPILYVPQIRAERVVARFGSSDLMIRYKPHGRKLEDALRSMNAPHKDIKTYLWADHSFAILRASREGLHDNLK